MGERKSRRVERFYELPPRCTVESFVVRELTCEDDLDITIHAEKLTPEEARTTVLAAGEARQREAFRLSLVEVNGEPVNREGVPYMEMDQWNQRTMRFLREAFEELNGAESDELRSFREGGKLRGRSEAPPPNGKESEIRVAASSKSGSESRGTSTE